MVLGRDPLLPQRFAFERKDKAILAAGRRGTPERGAQLQHFKIDVPGLALGCGTENLLEVRVHISLQTVPSRCQNWKRLVLNAEHRTKEVMKALQESKKQHLLDVNKAYKKC